MVKKYVGLNDLHQKSLKIALRRSYSLLGITSDTCNKELLGWFYTTQKILEEKREEEKKELDEWFCDIQRRMFGDDLPEPKIYPGEAIKYKIFPSNFEKYTTLGIESNTLPYLTYFILSGLYFLMAYLGTIFFHSPPIPLRFGLHKKHLKYPGPHRYFKDKDYIKVEGVDWIELTHRYGLIAIVPFESSPIGEDAVTFELRDPKILGKFKGKPKEPKVGRFTKRLFESIKDQCTLFVALSIAESNIRSKNLEVRRGLRASLLGQLSILLFDRSLIGSDLYRAFPHVHDLLDIKRDNYLDSFVKSIKRNVFNK